MGRGSDWRPPRRRGFDDDAFFSERPSRPSSRPRSFEGFGGGAPAPTGPTISAVVKWFKSDKGFGFVELSDGTGDAFLHRAVLERAGHDGVPSGATLQVRVGQGQKGPQVTEVLEVDSSTATPESDMRRDRGPRPAMGGGFRAPRGPVDLSQATEMRGTVKWYNAAKGFGFIVADDGGPDVFVHASVLERAGLAGLGEGQAVRMQVVQGRKGREAAEINPV